MTWSLFTMPALAVVSVAGALGAWWLLADLILDRIPVPCVGLTNPPWRDGRER